MASALTFPPRARAVVVCVHGGAARRLGRGDRALAGALRQAGFATLLVAGTGPGELDVRPPGQRAVEAIDWLESEAVVGDLPPRLRHLPVGCFGAGNDAAAALIAAAERPDRVVAVVSGGGRPDLALDALPRVTAPTLLVAGGNEPGVVRLNIFGQCRLGGESRLEVIPGASHRFEEPGALERMTTLTRDWFVRQLGGADAAA